MYASLHSYIKVENKAYHPGTGCKCAIVVARLPHDINFLLVLVPAQQQLKGTTTNDTITLHTLTHHKIENLPPSAAASLWGHLPTNAISISKFDQKGISVGDTCTL